jgi:hypothetical protein
MRSGCSGLTFQACMAACLDNVQFARAVDCLAENQAYDACQARVAPGLANWTCFDGFMPSPPSCDPVLNDLLTCEGF